MSKFIRIKTKGSKRKSWWRLEVDRIFNWAGGYSFLGGDDVIYETVEAKSFEDLDWSKTYLNQPDSDAGWLDRNGRFYGCDSRDHDACAWFLLKKKVSELEKTGWVRVYGPPECYLTWTVQGRLSAEQRNWLSRRGYVIRDDD